MGLIKTGGFPIPRGFPTIFPMIVTNLKFSQDFCQCFKKVPPKDLSHASEAASLYLVPRGWKLHGLVVLGDVR